MVDVRIRCNPSKLGELTGKLTVTGHIEKEVSVDLAAGGVAKLHKLTTFNNAHLAFGDGKSQVATGSFSFPSSQDKMEKITMFVKLRCPNGGCYAWDVFANIKVRHPETEEWMEIGRHITPCGVDNSQVEKGFPIDVKDFR